MRGVRNPVAVLLVVLVLLGCTGDGRGASATTRQSDPVRPVTFKSLTIAYAGEPAALSIGVSGNGSGLGGSGDISLAVNQNLVHEDERGAFHPGLAAELPSTENGTWQVRPDGTMRVTYRLRPDATWHDGVPVTAHDFVFARMVSMDDDLPLDRDILELTSSMEATDDKTLVVEWKVSYPWGGRLTDQQFLPLPAHVLERPYLEQKQSFLALPFWKEGYVGAGPFRVAEWQAGSHVVLHAYEGFFGGRARLDQLVFRFITDPNTVVANLLAGTVDGEIPRAVDLSQGLIVQREWERAGKRPVAILESESWRFLSPQFRSPGMPEILDVRVRRALLHAIDRGALAAALLDGQTPVAETLFPTNDPRWEWVKDIVVPYPYDPRRTAQLLAEVGWRPGADNVLARPSGEPAAIPLWTVGGQDTEKVVAIVADYWKEAGVPVDQYIIPRARARDLEFRASFPGFYYSGIGPQTFNTLRRMESRECPRPETQWVGSSLGCYQNPELDRTANALRGAIDPTEQRRLWRDVVRIQTQDLPVMPLFFNLSILLFRDGVSGVTGGQRPTWNVSEWDIR